METNSPGARPRGARHGPVSRFGGAALVVAACTGVGVLAHGRLEQSNLIMVYLLGVLITAVAFGRSPAIFAAIASVAAFDFGFVPPRLTFRVADSQYLVTFAVMLGVAILTGTLTARLREQREEARARERRTAALHRLAQDLAVRSTVADVAAAAVRRIDEALDASVAVVVPGSAGVEVLAGDASLREADEDLVQRALEAGEPGGLDGMAEPDATLFLPLIAGTQPIGVLCVAGRHGRTFAEPGRWDLVRAMTSLTALALERCRLAGEAQRAHAIVEIERSRNALLSSVSHDLRTPLAAITGAASGLLGGAGSESARRELEETIYDEARRLERLIANLLEMTRLESGTLAARPEWVSLEEVVGSALAPLEAELGARPVRIDVPVDLPLVPLDDVLFGTALRNLVENAHRYTPREQPIEICGRVAGGELRVDVADRGPGLGPGEEATVFAKFQRGRTSAGRPGMGLGLAICRGVVEAHGGRITARNRRGGGARFSIRIPIHDAPPRVAQEIEGVVDIERVHGG